MIGLVEEGWEAGSLPWKYSLGPVLSRKSLVGPDLPKKFSVGPELPKKSSLPVLTRYRKLEDPDLGDQVDTVR